MKSEPYRNVSKQVAYVVEDILKDADEYHQTHKARLARSAELFVDSDPYGVYLEVGSNGFFPLVARSLDLAVTFVATHFDMEKPLVSEVEYTLGKHKITVEALCVDLEHEILPVEDGRFDGVVCCEVLEHMEVDPMFMLSELNRASTDGASLLLTTPNVLSSHGLTKMVNGIEPYFFMQYHKSGEYHRHNYEYSAKSLWTLLKCAGYDVTVWSEDLFEDGLTDVVDRLREAGFDIQNVGDNLIATGKKTSPVVDRWPSGFYV